MFGQQQYVSLATLAALLELELRIKGTSTKKRSTQLGAPPFNHKLLALSILFRQQNQIIRFQSKETLDFSCTLHHSGAIVAPNPNRVDYALNSIVFPTNEVVLMKGQDSNPTGKILGIQHRRKQTAEGEARPTMVFDHLLQTVSPLGDEDKEVEFAKTGMQVGDKIAMVLGGSGDPFAYALGLRAQALGGETAVYRLPPFIFKERREEMDLPDDKTDDARLLALLLDAEPELFYKVKQYDMDLIWVKELTTQLFDTMKDRIACETRIRQRVIGTRLIDAGMYPQGKLEDAFKAAKANDIVFLALEKQEGQIERRLAKKLKKLPVFTEIFDLIDGVGPRIAARFISGVIDIRRFKTSAQLKAYCGVHCLADGSFARKRKGQVANWRPDIRQGLYQLSKQFEFRPNSYWGKRYRAVKARLRVIHPEIVVDEKSGKQKYTDAHINKMAKWRTLSLFVVYIFKAWKKLDAQAKQQKPNLELMDEHVA